MQLTKAKTASVAKRKPKLIKGNILHVNAGLQDKYSKALLRLVSKLVHVTRKEVLKLYETDAAAKHFGEDASITSQAKKLFNSLSSVFDGLFAAVAPKIAEDMVGDAEKQSTSALHSSLGELTGGLSLKTSIASGAMQETAKSIVTYNVGLIKSIATDYLDDVNKAVLRSITTGNGLEDLVPALDKHSDGTFNKAKNLALDQTRKAYNTINAEKSQSLGITHYEWIHSGGGKEPRELHIKYDGQVFAYDDPPVIDEATGERGIPGQAYNCRCTQRPVLVFPE